MNPLFLNPFIKIAGFKSLLIGLAIMLLTAVVGSFSGTHFDGVLDVHIGLKTLIWYFMLEVLVSWFSISIILLVASTLLSTSSVRFIDIVGTQALARYPFLIVSVISLLPFFQNQELNSPFIIVFAILCVLGVLWYGILVYNAFKVSSNLKGNKLIIGFVASLIIAEILSKYLIMKTYTLNFRDEI